MKPIELKNHLLKEVYKTIFKKNGFNISGTNFIKKEEGFVKVFNFQSSQFNSNESLSYYINIGIFFPEAYDFKFGNFYATDTIFETPINPKIGDCQFKWRAEEVLNSNKVYLIDRKTVHVKFIDMVEREVVNNFLPFFNSLSNLKDCLDFLSKKNTHHAEKVFIALTYASMGKPELSKDLIQDYFDTISPKDSVKRKIENALIKKGLKFDISNNNNENNIDNSNLTKGTYP